MSKYTATKNNIKIGLLLRQARRRSKLSQSQMAKKLGISKNHLSDLERGKYGLSVSTLLCFCKCLRTTPNELLDYNNLRTYDWSKHKVDKNKEI